MATLEDLQDVLKSIDENVKVQGIAVSSLSSGIQDFLTMAETNSRLRSVDTTAVSPTNTFSSNLGTGIGAGTGAAIAAVGGGLGAGLGILSSIAGVGVGIAGFFTALAGADAAISKFGDGSNLKVLMGNLSEGLASFSGRDLTALGALLASSVLFSSFAGIKSIAKAPVGMTAVGLGIGGFFSGLALGDELGEMTKNDLSGFKERMANLSGGLSAFSDSDLSALGGLLSGSVLFSSFAGLGKIVKAPVGMTAIGLGIGGFFSGLALGDELGAMVDNDLSGFSDKMKNLAEGLGAFSGRDLSALGGLLASSALFGVAAGPVASLKAATGMTLLGAGIGGFFAGLAFVGGLPDDSGENLKTTMINLSDGLKSFDTAHLAALGVIMGVGGVLGATTGAAGAAFAATGMGLMGVGIGAFISGMAGVGDLAQWMGSDGSGMKTMMTNIAEGLKAFDPTHLTALAVFMTAGGAAGATGFGLAAVAGASLGMGIIGAGIGAFIAGMAGVGDVAQHYGVDGSGIKTMLTNIGEGLNSFNISKLQGVDSAKIKTTLIDLSEGLLAITGTDLVASLAGVGTAFLDVISGKDGPITQVLTLADKVDDLNSASTALDAMANALIKFASIGTGAQVDIEALAKSAAGALPILRGLSEGGKIGSGLWDGPEIDFGPEKGPGKSGIFDEDLYLDQMLDRAVKVRNILAGISGSPVVSEISAVEGSVKNSVIQKTEISILSAHTEKMIELSQNIIKSLEMIEKSVAPKESAANNVTIAPMTDARTSSVVGSTNIVNNILKPSHTKGDLDYYFGN